MKRFLILVIASVLAFPVQGAGQKKDKPDPERKLVMVDSTAFNKTIDQIMKNYQSLDNVYQIVIRDALKDAFRRYQDANTYPKSTLELQMLLDSIPVLTSKLTEAENDLIALQVENDRLNEQIGEERQNLAAKEKLIADKDQALKEMEEALEKAQSQGSRAITIVDSKSEEILKDIQAAKASSLRELDPAYLEKLRASFNAVQPLLTLLDPDKEKSLKKEIDDVAELEPFRKVIAGADQLFSGFYDPEVQESLAKELESASKKKRQLSLTQQEEVALYQYALKHEITHIARFYDLLKALLNEQCLTRDTAIKNWQDKVAAFQKQEEVEKGWSVMTSLKKAVSALTSYLEYDPSKRIPTKLSDPDEFKKGIKSIWGIVSDVDLEKL